MRIRYLLVYIIVFQTFGQVFAWRSSLYPDTWTPGYKNASGQFLHDFSYAGYHRGETALPVITQNIVDITKAPYSADNTGQTDVRDKIQTALDDIGKAGGGVLYLPQGTYRINVSAAKANGISIKYPYTVLRGAGINKTYIYNDNADIRDIEIISIGNSSGGIYYPTSSTYTKITKDLLSPTDTIPVVSVSNFSVGDWVKITSDLTQGFIDEHKANAVWQPGDFSGPTIYRYIKGIDAAKNQLIIDAPTRYFFKLRDTAMVGRAVRSTLITECGVENFSIGCRQSNLTTFGDNAYDSIGTAAYQVHASYVIQFKNVVNCWAKNISTYRPAQNVSDIHSVSNAFIILNSRFVTIDSCTAQKPQYKGGGGNGYGFCIEQSNDCLIKDCYGNYNRHNFDFKGPATNGNVLWRCKSENVRWSTDFHMWFSQANLIDNLTMNKDLIEAFYRPYKDGMNHGYTSTECVIWNTIGQSYLAGQTVLIKSQQYGNGYVIGTSGAANKVLTPGNTNVAGWGNDVFDCNPVDFSEGIGTGATLLPVSLYADQLSKRLARQAAKPLSQTIYFEVPIKTYGNEPFFLTAYSTSGLAITYTSSNAAVATVSGNKITLTGVGSTTITASQGGNTNYLAAANVNKTLTVNKNTLNGLSVLATDNLIIFPNPTTNYLNVQLPENEKMLSCQIIDMQGKIIRSFFEITKNNIDLTGIRAGVYLIQINSKYKQIVIKK
ncbi:MAG: T9SS type A sorting domain-containing protein [Paludibacter sp.]|nr:T9SS type A sorting domain-containing protein [Paludibacter sp.]